MASVHVHRVLGIGLITVALIIHIVCVAMPYYSSAYYSEMTVEIKDWVALSKEDQSYIFDAHNTGLIVDNGLWLLCYFIGPEDHFQNGCKKWTEDFNPGEWLKGAQAFAILGILTMVVGLTISVLQLVWEIREYQRRFLPTVICAVCCLGGIFTLCGDVMIASNYRSDSSLPPPDKPISLGVRYIFAQQFFLNWGFGVDILSFVLACLAGVAHVSGTSSTSNWSGLVNNEDV